MANLLRVKFNWKRLLRSTNVTQKVSNSAKYRQQMKEADPAKYNTYLEKDAQRKKETYAAATSTVTAAEVEERKRGWTEAKRKQRAKKRKEAMDEKATYGPEPPKRLKDMTPTEKTHYMTLKKRESRQKITRQKKASVTLNEGIQRNLRRKEEKDKEEKDKEVKDKEEKNKEEKDKEVKDKEEKDKEKKDKEEKDKEEKDKEEKDKEDKDKEEGVNGSHSQNPTASRSAMHRKIWAEKN